MPEGIQLEFEMTESALLSSGRCVGVLQRLKDYGARIVIDDIGTGYSPLSQLKQPLADVLKIDRSFVCDLAAAADNVAIITAVIAMGHSLGLRSIAEGVTRADQFDMLSASGCDDIQGTLLFPAPSAEAVTRVLQRTADAAGAHYLRPSFRFSGGPCSDSAACNQLFAGSSSCRGLGDIFDSRKGHGVMATLSTPPRWFANRS